LPASPIRAAVLTPAADYPEAFDWALENQAAALTAAGLTVVAQTWTDADAGQGVDIVLPLVVWGYHARERQWHDLLDRLEAERARVLNPVALLRWNSDKSYLAELADRGIATVPTLAVDALADADLADARARFDATEMVIKPPVSAGADGTFRLGPNDAVPAAVAGRRMLIQPFQHSIVGQGELSLMIFNGAFSHAVIKRAKPGDFRVQPSLGGTEIQVEAPRRPRRRAHRRRLCPRRHDRRRHRRVADHGTRIDRARLIPPPRARQRRALRRRHRRRRRTDIGAALTSGWVGAARAGGRRRSRRPGH